MLYCWAEDPGNAIKVSRIAGIYPCCDFFSIPGLERTAKIWGMDAAAHNPIDRLQTLKDAGVKIFHFHGDADTIVPLKRNSQVIIDRYKALGGDATLVVIPGKGHAEIPEYFHNQARLDFLLAELKDKHQSVAKKGKKK
jgi:pimeloyl-ACP methyl ester carboxylesterase